MAALGVLLLVVGAILVWAVEKEAEGFDLTDLGWILIAGGGLSLLIGAIQASAWWGARNRHAVTERHVSPDGSHYVEETHFD